MRMGKQTIKFQNPPSILATASIAGKKEGEGPLANYFDQILEDAAWGETTWEKAESKIMKETISLAVNKSQKTLSDIQYIFAGDLLNQCIGSTFGIRDLAVPFFGLFGACSTMAESLSLAAITVDSGNADCVVAATSSHFCSAEKQFRFPLEYGGQRSPTTQWTVTGSGAVVVGSKSTAPFITHITTGKILDLGIKDSSNMGAAMAPAAVDTIFTHFDDTGRDTDEYDLIITGDLGQTGKEIAQEMILKKGCNINSKNQYTDCGIKIFDMKKQDVHSGGSGCGCSAVVLAGYLYHQMIAGDINKILFVSTGALMNPTTIQQGESIPGIAHAVSIENSLS